MSLRVLIVDDEPLARSRLRTLLGECRAPAAVVAGEAADAAQARALLRSQPFDLVLVDIHMPGEDGMSLAASLQALPHAPALVFVTAHAEHALHAFELAALDYLTKPVRLQRLQVALQRALRLRQPPADAAEADDALLVSERGGVRRVPLRQVLYLKAEAKYLTVRTADASHLLDGSLSQLEERYPARWLRVHRNALVARQALRALVRHHDAEEGEGWAVQLAGVDELLPVSRRQLAVVREALGAP